MALGAQPTAPGALRAEAGSSFCWPWWPSASGPAVFGVFYRVLRYIQSTQEVGGPLAAKLLGIVLLSFASLLLLSNLITALSSFFLAKDLDLLVSSPVDWLRIYFAKLSETILHSSWMVALMAVPIFTAYGIVFKGGPLFPLVSIGALVPYFVLPGGHRLGRDPGPGQRLPGPAHPGPAEPGGDRRVRWSGVAASG